jgi:hypothetical protein
VKLAKYTYGLAFGNLTSAFPLPTRVTWASRSVSSAREAARTADGSLGSGNLILMIHDLEWVARARVVLDAVVRHQSVLIVKSWWIESRWRSS